MRSELNIIRRDWSEYWKPVVMLTGSMFVPLLLGRNSPDFSQGLIGGLLVSAAFGYAQFCFFAERQRGTLQLLLSLPVRPMNMVLAKYLSSCSMALFTANIPGLFLGSASALFLINCAAIFMATVCMTASVISEKPWAPQVPMWIFVLILVPSHALLSRYWPGATRLIVALGRHPAALAAFSLLASFALAVSAAWLFERKQSR